MILQSVSDILCLCDTGDVLSNILRLYDTGIRFSNILTLCDTVGGMSGIN